MKVQLLQAKIGLYNKKTRIVLIFNVQMVNTWIYNKDRNPKINKYFKVLDKTVILIWIDFAIIIN